MRTSRQVQRWPPRPARLPPPPASRAPSSRTTPPASHPRAFWCQRVLAMPRGMVLPAALLLLWAGIAAGISTRPPNCTTPAAPPSDLPIPQCPPSSANISEAGAGAPRACHPAAAAVVSLLARRVGGLSSPLPRSCAHAARSGMEARALRVHAPLGAVQAAGWLVPVVWRVSRVRPRGHAPARPAPRAAHAPLALLAPPTSRPLAPAPVARYLLEQRSAVPA